MKTSRPKKFSTNVSEINIFFTQPQPEHYHYNVNIPTEANGKHFQHTPHNSVAYILRGVC